MGYSDRMAARMRDTSYSHSDKHHGFSFKAGAHRYSKNRFNRCRRHCLEAIAIEEWIDEEMVDVGQEDFDNIQEEKLSYLDDYEDYEDYDDYDDWDDSDYIYFYEQDPYYSKLEAWERFEAAQAIEDPQDDLEWAFSGEWLKELEAA